jgi:UDP-N-acetylglucosamine 1-carboxyvinyltransferase
MDKLRIIGGRRLEGEIAVSGAKNAALPAMAASLLTSEPVILHRIPDLRDVSTMGVLLEGLGATVERPAERTLRLTCEKLGEPSAPYELVKTMRASVLVLGPLIARCGRAAVSLPGGCAIGIRPIDLHLTALRKLGVDFEIEHGYVRGRAGKLHGGEIFFEKQTVTGTENVLMAACLADGTTMLRNCAKEPEVADLATLLSRMGAKIEGAGTDTIRVEGVGQLHGCEHEVIPDRIEAGTLAVAAAMSDGDVRLTDCRPEHLDAVLERLRAAGVGVETGGGWIRVRTTGGLKAVDVRTMPYPGFPTDMQAQFAALMTRADGISILTETIFENRFMHVSELLRMGAEIRIEEGSAIVRGPVRLTGAGVMATDLRASASLVIAGLAAHGATIVDRVYHLDRGYVRIDDRLKKLGAEIERVRD